MIVKLDLRPEGVKNAPPPKTRKWGLLMLCAFLIFASVMSYTWFSMIKDILFLQDRINTLSNQVDDLRTVRIGLTAELARLSQEEAVYASSLSIMQQELPTIEVFNSIERAFNRGITLTSLVLTHTNLSLVGVANTEDNIVDTTRNLLDTGIFSVAQVPVVSRANMGPEGLSFSLSLAPLGIGEIRR